MKYLLDTHTAIWALDDKTKLSKTAKTIIDDVSISLCVSIISAKADGIAILTADENIQKYDINWVW